MLLNYHIGRFVLGSLCVRDLVWLGLSGVRVAGWRKTCASACNTDTIKHSHSKSPTHDDRKQTTDVVIQQYSRKLLMMDILMSETFWVRKKWNKVASYIKLVFYSSTVLCHICHWMFHIICNWYRSINRRAQGLIETSVCGEFIGLKTWVQKFLF